jgi:hypothetical protein
MRFRHLCWVCTVAALLGLSLSFPGYADRLQEILEQRVALLGGGSGLPPSGFALAGIDGSPARLTDQVDVAIVVIGAAECRKQSTVTPPTASL